MPVNVGYAAVRFDEERSAFAVNLPSGGGEFYLHPAAVRRADTRCVPALLRAQQTCTLPCHERRATHAPPLSRLVRRRRARACSATSTNEWTGELSGCARCPVAGFTPRPCHMADAVGARARTVRPASTSGRGSAHCATRTCRRTCARPACSRWATTRCRSPGRTASTRCPALLTCLAQYVGKLPVSLPPRLWWGRHCTEVSAGSKRSMCKRNHCWAIR